MSRDVNICDTVQSSFPLFSSGQCVTYLGHKCKIVSIDSMDTIKNGREVQWSYTIESLSTGIQQSGVFERALK